MALTCLLDVNVVIALVDPLHAGHDAAHRWFDIEGRAGWATCPLTENGVIRIVALPRYANSAGSPAAAAAVLAGFCALPGHVFWSDDISLLDANHVDPTLLLTPGQVTDSYLLALAVSRGGRLATFDRRLSTGAVKGGKQALVLIPG